MPKAAPWYFPSEVCYVTSSSMHHEKVGDQNMVKYDTILPCPHQHLSSCRSPNALAIVVVPVSPVETPQKGGGGISATVVIDPLLTMEQLLTCSLVYSIIGFVCFVFQKSVWHACSVPYTFFLDTRFRSGDKTRQEQKSIFTSIH